MESTALHLTRYVIDQVTDTPPPRPGRDCDADEIEERYKATQYDDGILSRVDRIMEKRPLMTRRTATGIACLSFMMDFINHLPNPPPSLLQILVVMWMAKQGPGNIGEGEKVMAYAAADLLITLSEPYEDLEEIRNSVVKSALEGKLEGGTEEKTGAVSEEQVKEEPRKASRSEIPPLSEMFDAIPDPREVEEAAPSQPEGSRDIQQVAKPELHSTSQATDQSKAQSQYDVLGDDIRRSNMPFGKARYEPPPEGVPIDEFVRLVPSATNISYFPDNLKEIKDPQARVTTVVPVRQGNEPKDPGGYTVWQTNYLTKSFYFSQSWFPRPLHQISRKKYEIKLAPDGSGMGVFATQDIKTNELVMIERPYLVIPVHNAQTVVTPRGDELTLSQISGLVMQQTEKAFRVMVDLFTDEDLKGFMSLANAHTEDGSGEVMGRVRTNAFAIHFGGGAVADKDFAGRGYGAVAKEGSRFNHRCSPDVRMEFDQKSFALRFNATRPIKAGAQIFTTYVSVTASKAERERSLKPYGIECKCPYCLKATPATDQLRKSSNKMCKLWLRQCQTRWLKDPKLNVKILDPILEVKKRMEDEGLDILEAGYFYLIEVIYHVYQKLGMRKEADEAGFMMYRFTNDLIISDEREGSAEQYGVTKISFPVGEKDLWPERFGGAAIQTAKDGETKEKVAAGKKQKRQVGSSKK